VGPSRSATTRDQPPESFAVTRTSAEPNVSMRARKRPLVRVALAIPVSVFCPPNTKWSRRVGGIELYVYAFPRQGSAASDSGVVTAATPSRYFENHRVLSSRTCAKSGPGNVEGVCPKSPT
jgi:hypothetical protein